jgi:two-component system, OmpR family, lantibiotic biosynthesis sensor histidine kinase NisK/SpaK
MTNKNISFSLDKATIDELEQIAERNGLSLDQTAKEMVIDYIQNEKNKDFRLDDIKYLAQSAAHEMLIPLQSIIGMLGMVRNQLAHSNLQDREIFNIILISQKEIVKLAFIANNIADYANKWNTLNNNFRQLNIINIINYVVDLYTNEASSRGIKFKIAADHLIDTMVLGSETDLKLLFFNILSNSVKYSFNNKYIKILVKNCSNGLCIKISNYGVGIEDYEIKKGLIFSKGYRGVLVRDRNRYGSGLGLFTAKRIVDEHGGKIKVSSRKLPSESNEFITTINVHIPQKGVEKIAKKNIVG